MKIRAHETSKDAPGAVARRLETATDWMLRLDDDAVTDQDILNWLDWCDADPRNQHAFDEVKTLWTQAAPFASEVRGFDFSDELEEAPLAPTRRPAGPIGSWTVRLKHILSESLRPLAFASLGGVAALLALFALQRNPIDVNPNDVARIVEPAGERPTATQPLVSETRFDDGSWMQFATGSKLEVQYSSSERALTLERGEAYFQVAKAHNRPFTVAAGEVRITAVGTAFNVRRSGERVVVSVTEGVVSVARNDSLRTAGDTGIRVWAGSQLRWDGIDHNPVMVSLDSATVLGWREGRLAYSDEPFAAVVADYNRYASRPLWIEDPGIGNLRYSGTLFTQNAEAWLLALEILFPVEIAEVEGGLIIRFKDEG